MIHGLFLDPRTWAIDYQTSPFWAPDRYGVKIDLHEDAFNIPKTGIDQKYKFVICTEVWEVPMRKTLQYLRNKGVKIFFMPREVMTFSAEALFEYDHHLYNGDRFFKPDVVFAPNNRYAELWGKFVKTVVTGHPKFDYCINNYVDANGIREKYELSRDRKILFFPLYPPRYFQKIHGIDNFVDISTELEDTASALEDIANRHSLQVVAKLHPMTHKMFKKGNSKEITGIILKYFIKPCNSFKVIGDKRMSSEVARDILSVSEYVVGYTSTMLVEAALLDKKILHVNIGRCQNFVCRPWYDDIFETAKTVDEIEKIVTGVKKYDRGRMDEFTHYVDGKCCERTCAEIIRNI
jgi:hypothetical protein